MVVKHDRRCEAASSALAVLRTYVLAQQEQVNNKIASEYLQRDRRFLEGAHAALAACSPKEITDLLEEMRGLRHYFGSYCADLHRLDELIEDLFASLKASFSPPLE